MQTGKKAMVMSGIVLLACAVVLAGGFAWAMRGAQEKISVVYLPITNSLPFFVALEEGLFAKAGLDVEAVKFQAPNQIIDALVTGKAQGGVSAAAGITLIALQQFPDALKVIGMQGGSAKGTEPAYQDSLLTRKESPIRTMADLRGKKLGIVPGIQWRTITRHLLKKHGLDPDKDVQLVEIAVQQHVSALLSGSVDATLSLEPAGAIAESTGEAVRRDINVSARTIADPFLAGVAVVTKKFLEERPQDAEAYIRVLTQATEMVQADFPRYRPLLAKYTGLKSEQLPLVTPSVYRTWVSMDEEAVDSYQILADIFFAEGALRQKVDVRDVLYRLEPVGSLRP